MIRLRKYRIFVVVALASLSIVWYLSRDAAWEGGLPFAEFTRSRGYGQLIKDPNQASAEDTSAQEPGLRPLEQVSPPEDAVHPNHAATAAFVPADAREATSTHKSSTTAATINQSTEESPSSVEAPSTSTALSDAITPTSLVETAVESSTIEHKYTWTSRPDRFPIPTGSTIRLPTGTPKAIPQIQHAFERPTPQVKNELKVCLDEVKKAMKRTWGGYTKYAWMKDELKPDSGGFKDKFMGWAATLVDSLDTLWIMGMEREFEDAVEAVAKIDFKESTDNGIPMFETTIRYLGGLLGAYDISGGEHQVLLDKAVELGDILMSAFDTSNRSPLLHPSLDGKYQQRQSSPSSGLAELGSLSVEFTRLAQLSKEPRYYDAIARITDSLAELQTNTEVPGLWPLRIDTSGCNIEESETTPRLSAGGGASGSQSSAGDELPPDKDRSSFGHDSKTTQSESDTRLPAQKLKEDGSSSFANDSTTSAEKSPKGGSSTSEKGLVPEDLKEKARSASTEETIDSNWNSQDAKGSTDSPGFYERLRKRQLGPSSTSATNETEEVFYDSADYDNLMVPSDSSNGSQDRKCTSPQYRSGGVGGRYTLGGEADSTYEYLTKEYLLLGGNVNKYRTMYEAAVEATKKFLLFRPWIEDEGRRLMFTGDFTPGNGVKQAVDKNNGTLYPSVTHLTCFVGGMLALGAKVFDRPEELELAGQVTDTCVWAYNATVTGVMPEAFTPLACPSMNTCPWNETAWHWVLDPEGEERDRRAAEYANTTEKSNSVADNSREPVPGAPPVKSTITLDDLNKRQLETDAQAGYLSDQVLDDYDIVEPEELQTHAEFVQSRIELEGLFPGALRLNDRRYLLRPEAIESVFYMYRTTGDIKWQRKGLAMWMAIDKSTKATYGNSAINNVMSKESTIADEMESFWPAETLKYFYLLFSDDHDLVNLDDYVL